MSDENIDRDDGFDDRIRRSMTGLGAGAAQLARPATGADIRHRASRRRQVMAAGTLSAVLIIGGGAVVAGDVLDRPGTGTLVVPGHSASPTTPTPEPTDGQATTAPPTEAPTTSAPASSEPSTNPPPTEIPAGFTLPHEGETSDDSDYSDWQTVEGLSTAWNMAACNKGRYDGDESRTDFRQVFQTGPEWYDTHTLAVYPDAAVAVAVMADMRAAIQACVDKPSGESDILSWHLREVEVGGEAFVAVASLTDAGGSPLIGGGHYGVTRLGNAIYLTAEGGESFPSVDDAQSADLVERLQDYVPEMCVFTVAGC